TYVGGVRLDDAPGAIANDSDSAAAFDGSDDGVRIGNFYGFPGDSRFSLEAWIKPESVDGFRVILSKLIPGGAEGYRLYFYANRLLFQRCAAGVADSIDAALPPLGVYSHVVATFDGITMLLYLNASETGGSAVAEQQLID